MDKKEADRIGVGLCEQVAAISSILNSDTVYGQSTLQALKSLSGNADFHRLVEAVIIASAIDVDALNAEFEFSDLRDHVRATMGSEKLRNILLETALSQFVAKVRSK